MAIEEEIWLQEDLKGLIKEKVLKQRLLQLITLNSLVLLTLTLNKFKKAICKLASIGYIISQKSFATLIVALITLLFSFKMHLIKNSKTQRNLF
jgi:hypothetical protein